MDTSEGTRLATCSRALREARREPRSSAASAPTHPAPPPSQTTRRERTRLKQQQKAQSRKSHDSRATPCSSAKSTRDAPFQRGGGRETGPTKRAGDLEARALRECLSRGTRAHSVRTTAIDLSFKNVRCLRVVRDGHARLTRAYTMESVLESRPLDHARVRVGTLSLKSPKSGPLETYTGVPIERNANRHCRGNAERVASSRVSIEKSPRLVFGEWGV